MLSERSRLTRLAALAALVGAFVTGTSAAPTGAAEPGAIRVTEWMYDGAGGEWIELTNVGGEPVDLAGWTYDDDSANPAVGFDLGAFGVVAPGESVVLTESEANGFRATWGLCAGVDVVGGYTNNLGRADQVNIFDAADVLVDRLTYGDQTVGGPRTQGASAWVSAAGLGADVATQWTKSTVGDAEASVANTGGAIGSPGRSTRATVAFDPCAATAGPVVELDRAVAIGAVGDPTNPTVTLTVTPETGSADDVVVAARSSRPAVLADEAITVTGTGATRSVAFAPSARGTATVTFEAVDDAGATSSTTLAYAASAAPPSPAGRYLHGVSDASAVLEVGDGHVLVANDETNTIFLFDLAAGSSDPVKTWSLTAAQTGTSSEVDFEGVARAGDTLLWVGSHGNNREGAVRAERRTIVETSITGSGATTEIAFVGRFTSLWEQVLAWDAGNGHGLGADALGLVAAAAPGVAPNAPDGFNVEGFEMAPDGTTGYLGMRAPTVERNGKELALVVPVTNVVDLPGSSPAAQATFGAPVLLDLDGRSVRELRANDEGDYLISAGPSDANPTWALYGWDGDPATAPVKVKDLPAEDPLTGGTWESIVSVPHPLGAGAEAVLVTDSGDTDFYGTGATKDLSPAYQKSYLQPFTLDGPTPPPVAVARPQSASVVEGDDGTTTLRFPLVLDEPAAGPVTVSFSTVHLPALPWPSATPEVDYTPTSGVVSFAAGDTVAYAEVPVVGDGDIEPDEVVPVAFRNPVGARIESSFFGLGLGSVRDDDGVVIVPGSGTVQEGDTGTTVLRVPVTLTEASTQAVTIDWSTIDWQAPAGTALRPAVAGEDFAPGSGTLTFAPGQTEAYVDVLVVGDTVVEGDEGVLVWFRSPGGGARLLVHALGLGGGVIEDDDTGA